MADARPTDRRFALRYVAVAGSCALLHNAIVIAAAWAGTGIVGAAIVSFCTMIVVGYLLVCGIAFRMPPTLAGFMRYTGAMAGNFPLSTALLWLLAVPCRLPVPIVAPVVTGAMMGINFIATRWAVRRRPQPCAS